MEDRTKGRKIGKDGYLKWSFVYADVAELADAQVSGSCGQPCGFESLRPHQKIGDAQVGCRLFFNTHERDRIDLVSSGSEKACIFFAEAPRSGNGKPHSSR